MRSVGEIGRFVSRMVKAKVSNPLTGEGERRDETRSAPPGTNAFLRRYAGTDIQKTGEGKLMVNDENCKGGVCVNALYIRTKMDGSIIFFHAHVREDDTYEDAHAWRNPEGDLCNTEYLGIDDTLRQVEEDLIERVGGGSNPNDS